MMPMMSADNAQAGVRVNSVPAWTAMRARCVVVVGTSPCGVSGGLRDAADDGGCGLSSSREHGDEAMARPRIRSRWRGLGMAGVFPHC